MLNQTRLLAGTLLLAALAACSSPSDDRGGSSDSTIPETVAPTCTKSDAGTESDGGSEQVCTCKKGYELDGDVCRFVNLCEKTENGGCDQNATCTPKIDDRTCTCKSGFTGNGETCTAVSTTCGTCDANATCKAVGAGKACVCNTGYVGDGTTCISENSPCAKNNGGCSVNAICTPTSETTVQCTCKQGYEGNGVDCVAIDPCKTNNGGCSTNATCSRADDGSAKCTCKSGYSGDGHTCTSNKGNIGSTCADSSQQSQSNCQASFKCFPLTESNYCTKECQSNDECGTNGGYQNQCLNVGANLCLRGCDPSDRSTCGRSDLACYDADDTGTTGVCFPACFSDDDCRYGNRCDTTSGVCNPIACNSNGTCSDSNDTCYTRTENGATVKSCVPKCTLNGCPEGRQCNSTTKACDAVARNTYETCGTGVGDCATSDTCVGFGTPGSLCMRNCTTNSNCPSGSTCTVSLGSGQKVCAVTCGTSSSPDNSVCPSGTACSWFTDSSQTKLFCGPGQTP